MRKQLYAVAAAILAAGMLAGCSGGAKETEEQRYPDAHHSSMP